MRIGVSHASGIGTTLPAMRRLGMAYLSDGIRRAAARRLRLPLPDELRDQHGVVLVVADVVEVGGARVVVERDELSVRVERAAHRDRVGGTFRVPRGFFLAASTARAPDGRARWRGTPLRSRRRRPRCARTPAVPASRRRARSRAGSSGTARRRSASRTTSCRSSRSSAARSTDRPARARDRTRCVPGTARRTAPRRSSRRPRTPLPRRRPRPARRWTRASSTACR